MRNNFSSRDSNDNNDFSELSNDFMYTTGASDAGSIYIGRDNNSYTFSMQKKDDDDWLTDIKDMMNGITGGDKDITQRSDGSSEFKIGHKDTITKMDDLKNNLDEIRNLNDDQQNSWLSGILDAKLTIDAKGHSEPTSQMRDKDLDKLNLTKDILDKNGIDSKMEFHKGKNPTLKIRGYKNQQKLKNKLRRNSKINKLNKMLKDKGRFREFKKDDYDKIRQELGYKFQDFLNEVKPIIRPDSPDYELKNPKNDDGKDINPDELVKNPDGDVEGLEAKLTPKQFDAKDKDYLKHDEIDSLTPYYLEGNRSQPKDAHGKDINHKSKDDLQKELENAKDKQKTKEGKTKIQDKINKLNKLAKEAEKSKEAKDKAEKD